MDVLVSKQTGPTTIAVEVSIPFSDGDLAEAATVTATLTGPNDQTITAVPIPRSSSASPSYAADLAVPGPGTWVIDLRSTQPVAEATVEVEVRDTSSNGAEAGGPGPEADHAADPSSSISTAAPC